MGPCSLYFFVSLIHKKLRTKALVLELLGTWGIQTKPYYE